MLVSILKGCLLAALVTGAACAAGAQTREAPKPDLKPDLMWGANGHPLISYPGTTYEQQLDYLKELGMTSYRVDIGAVAQAAELERLVVAAKPRGIEILPVIAPGLSLDKLPAEELYAKAYEVAVALVSRLKGKVRVWELGNELENYAIIQPCERQDDGVQYNCAWGPAGGVGPLEYYGPRWRKVSAVLKGLSDGATAADPTVRKAMGTAGWGHVGAFKRMQQDGIRWDISVWHMYGGDPEWAFKVLAGFNRPVWVTEFNNPLGGQRSAAEQADGLVRAMTRLRQLRRAYNVEAAHVYELMDEPYWAPSFEASMGLVTLVKDQRGAWRPGERKPAFAAVERMIAAGAPAASPADDCHLNPYNRLDAAASMIVSYAYCLLLRRPADGHGFKAWKDALEAGRPVSDLLVSMLESEEFSAKHGAAHMGSAELVSLLYRVLLYREPDGAGLASYVSQLEAGTMSRTDLRRSIIGSDELRSRHPLLFATAGMAASGSAAPD